MNFDATSRTLSLPEDCRLSSAAELVSRLRSALSTHQPAIISGKAIKQVDSATLSLLLEAIRQSPTPLQLADMPENVMKLAKLYDLPF